MTFVQDEADPISPVSIDHHVDEVWADKRGGTLREIYNFIDYHFEREGRYCRARMYLDDPSSVTVYGPFSARDSLSLVDDHQLEADVLGYLGRRFGDVKRL